MIIIHEKYPAVRDALNAHSTHEPRYGYQKILEVFSVQQPEYPQWNAIFGAYLQIVGGKKRMASV